MPSHHHHQDVLREKQRGGGGKERSSFPLQAAIGTMLQYVSFIAYS